MNGDIEMPAAEEDLRDAMRDEAAFPEDPSRLKIPHDHMNPDGTEQTPSRALLNALPERK